MCTLSAAILTNGRGEFFLDQVALCDPGPGEVLVEIHASGVCHTDYDTMRWGRTMVMGHEAMAGFERDRCEGICRHSWRYLNARENELTATGSNSC
jgi:hypothetical protein